MTVEIELLYCPTCARECLAEVPPCPDGHDDCPDRACVDCGTALVLDAGLAGVARLSVPGVSAVPRASLRATGTIGTTGASAHRRAVR